MLYKKQWICSYLLVKFQTAAIWIILSDAHTVYSFSNMECIILLNRVILWTTFTHTPSDYHHTQITFLFWTHELEKREVCQICLIYTFSAGGLYWVGTIFSLRYSSNHLTIHRKTSLIRPTWDQISWPL